MASYSEAQRADIRTDDLEFNPEVSPQPSQAWINLLKESEKAFEQWNKHCDNIDELYASLKRLGNASRPKEFQMFWANCEVLKPSIYATPPVPVVTPKFKDRRPVYQQASEVLERCIVVAFDIAYINEIMLYLRDDLALTGRGVPWVRYESKREAAESYASSYDCERVCIDYKPRKDFLHSLSRCWAEVTWVAAASYLTRSEARDRFYESSGDEYQNAEYKVDKDSQEIGGTDARERACFWEIWDKTTRRVYWVAEGCEKILDEGDPHLDLSGFFPCPKPAYGCLQRGSLVPVPDALQYNDQLDEINTLTGRIHAISNALEVKGFYPAGGGELSEAIQTAIKTHTPGQMLIPISNWAAFGGSKEVIIWLPIDTISQTLTALVTLRKQVIDDVYQIMGLSDIMRGSTDPNETLGAQTLKTEYGSSRVRDKQYELVRVARDLVVLTADIITTKFADATIIQMSQTTLPTKAMQQQQVREVQRQAEQQIAQLMQQPQVQQMLQQNPAQAAQAQNQAVQALNQQISEITSQVNLDQVLDFLRDNQARAFTLDIETDSTIVVDEDAEKQRRTEFIGVLSQLLPQLSQLVTVAPQLAKFGGDILKFATAPYRTGRSLDSSIDDAVEQMEERANGPHPDDPTTAAGKIQLQIESMKQQRQAQQDQAANALKAQELQLRDNQEKMKIASNERIKMLELNSRNSADAAKAQQLNLQAMQEHEAHQAEILGQMNDMRIANTKLQMEQAKTVSQMAAQRARAAQPPRPSMPGG